MRTRCFCSKKKNNEQSLHWKGFKFFMKIGSIIQARAGSTRLPGKVFKELPFNSGITVLEQVIRRLKKSNRLDEIILATTENREDAGLVKIAKKDGIKYFRGSESDVLARYYRAAVENSLDVVVRITGDCPCIDPEILDLVVDAHMRGGADYTSNILQRTYPHGLDVEVFSFGALRLSFESAKADFEREHVTPFILRSGKFSLQNVGAPDKLKRPDIRITLDTVEDYALLCAVYEFLYQSAPFFGARAIVGLFEKNPWLKLINEKILQKKIFASLDEELKEALKILELQDLNRAGDFIKRTLTS